MAEQHGGHAGVAPCRGRLQLQDEHGLDGAGIAPVRREERYAERGRPSPGTSSGASRRPVAAVLVCALATSTARRARAASSSAALAASTASNNGAPTSVATTRARTHRVDRPGRPLGATPTSLGGLAAFAAAVVATNDRHRPASAGTPAATPTLAEARGSRCRTAAGAMPATSSERGSSSWPACTSRCQRAPAHDATASMLCLALFEGRGVAAACS